MKSIISLLVAGVTLLSTVNASAHPYPTTSPARRDGQKALTYVGCYSSAGSMTFNTNYTFNTQGSCQGDCVSLTGGDQYPVLGTSAKVECWCGAEQPPDSDKVDESMCNTGCAGFGTTPCGGNGYWSVWLTGATLSLSSDSSSDSTSSTTTKPPSSTATSNPTITTVINGVTVTATAAASSSTPTAKSSGPSKAAIAAGVVVGLVLFAAVAVGVWALMRHRRRREIEAEHARQAAVSSFIGNSKPPSSASTYFSDPRIEPAVLAHRRMSDGSIADSQDYSRRILKVTNA